MGCAARIGQPTGSRGHSEGSFVDEIFDVSSRLEAYAPTDPRRPMETMIHVEAFVDIKPTDGGASFMHNLSYFASPAYPEWFDASYDEILIIPDSEDIRQRYSDQFAEGTIVLSQENAVMMQRDSPEQPRLGEIEYRLVTRNHEHVATLFVPFWLETD